METTTQNTNIENIKVETLVAGDVNQVWAYWTKPEHITKWNFASDDWHCPRAESDLRVGGKMVSRMEAKDGSFGFDLEGTFDEVAEYKKISYTMADGRKVTTTFEDAGGRTKVVTVFDAEGENSIEMQKNGWQAISDNFKKYAEGKKNKI